MQQRLVLVICGVCKRGANKMRGEMMTLINVACMSALERWLFWLLAGSLHLEVLAGLYSACSRWLWHTSLAGNDFPQQMQRLLGVVTCDVCKRGAMIMRGEMMSLINIAWMSVLRWWLVLTVRRLPPSCIPYRTIDIGSLFLSLHYLPNPYTLKAMGGLTGQHFP